MARPYSEDFLLNLSRANPNRLGVKLAKTCVQAGFPLVDIAGLFDTSRQTIHNWFRGGAIRDKNQTKIERFLEIVEKDLENNVLPTTKESTVQYIETKLFGKI